MGLDYQQAGVDIGAGQKLVEDIKAGVRTTHGPEVLTGLGGFGALYEPDLSSYQKPVFVSGTDGVGTKLKIAFMLDKHETVGVDLVAMCVNDILAQGAKPLFFLDYLATGKLNREQMKNLISGIVEGCRQAGCALIGGETAEMPGFYRENEYDMAGFSVGIVDKDKIITGESIEVGDKILGLASSGLHSNGFSLVRKVFFDLKKYKPDKKFADLDSSLGEELLKPTRIYVKNILPLLEKYKIKGIAHITGGGLYENIPRLLASGQKAIVNKSNWFRPPIFELLKKEGDIAEKEMYRTFNMGLGLVLIVEEKMIEGVVSELEDAGEKVDLIGEIVSGEKSFELQ